MVAKYKGILAIEKEFSQKQSYRKRENNEGEKKNCL
jgi:hypothetical protein